MPGKRSANEPLFDCLKCNGAKKARRYNIERHVMYKHMTEEDTAFACTVGCVLKEYSMCGSYRCNSIQQLKNHLISTQHVEKMGEKNIEDKGQVHIT